jgi:PAS domain S-box-containing protein
VKGFEMIKRNIFKSATGLLGAILLGILALSTVVSGNSIGTVSLTDAERQWLLAHPNIKLAPDPDFKPIEFFDRNGRYQGAAADIIGLVEKKLGITITVVRLKNWDEAMEKFKKQEIDVLGAMVRTPNREKFALFTDTIVTVPGGIFARNGSRNYLTLKDLNGKKVAVVSNYTAQDVLASMYPEIKLDVVPDVSTGLAKASLGMVDAYVENMANATYYSQEAGITNLQLVGKTDFEYRWGIGIRKDWPELQSILNKGLAAVTAEERERSIRHWVHVESMRWQPSRVFMATGFSILLGVIVLGIAGWNFSLRGTVRRRTAALNQELEERRKAEQALTTMTEQLEDTVRERTAELVLQMEERKKSEELFRELFQNAADPIYIADLSGKILAANNPACRELGYSSDELLTRHIKDLDVEFYAPEKVEAFFRDLLASRSVTFETSHRRKDGSTFQVEIHASVINYNETRSIMGVVRNVSERKLNELRMGSLYNISQYPFTTEQDFLDYALHEVIILSGSAFGYIYFYSEKQRQFTLNSWSQAVMKECSVLEQNTMYDLDSTGMWGEAVRQRQPILINDFQAHHPLKKGLPAGHVPMQRFLTIPVIVEGVIVAVVGIANKQCDYVEADIMQLNIFMDAVWKVVARKRAEVERQNMEKQLLHAQKLESLGVLAGGIAHDFNNILMAIMGNADLALMRINKESPAVDNLHKIEQSAARAADLAKQMLAYSGKGKFVIEDIDLNHLMKDMLHMLEVSISKKAVLRLNPYHPLPSVEADATQMRQIIMNLVINASEAIGDRSGVIAITTGCMDCDRSYLKDVWLDENISEGLYVYLEIADSGCGMDKETLAKLFDPFFTTKFTGRGLGMAAVLGIIRGHKGAIKVYSEPGKGTSFKILLPASDRPAELFNGVHHQDEWRGKGTVLLVDDEETVRGIGAEMLKELGFKVMTANDGREAVERFKLNPDVAIVILDLTMPHMDGEQCFRELRQLKPDIKVIMSSGYNEQEVTQKFVGKGLAGFIQKPYRLSTLKDVIRLTQK